jgi:hypothetical protein
MTPTETRKAENAKKRKKLVAEFNARVEAADPNDPLTDDKFWNPTHPEYTDEVGTIPDAIAREHAEDVATGHAVGRRLRSNGASSNEAARISLSARRALTSARPVDHAGSDRGDQV